MMHEISLDDDEIQIGSNNVEIKIEEKEEEIINSEDTAQIEDLVRKTNKLNTIIFVSF